MPPNDNPAQFITKWSRSELSERAASQEHFLDLCRLLGQPTPAEHDATGAEYTFEKGVKVTGAASQGSAGNSGFADVWWRGKFGWEYKRKGKYRDLADAYRQLCQYREALENPPLLIVSDIARTQIHTNFTGTKKEVHQIALADLGEPDNLNLLRRVFTDPESFRPEQTSAKITEVAAERFAKIANNLRQRGNDPHDAAHFLMKCMFCLFAEDVGLLPKELFTRLLERSKDEPPKLTARLSRLFSRMSTGGDFGADEIAYFNGGLFDEAPALELRRDEIVDMQYAALEDWGAVEPAIFGTLFERSLDPDKRAQIGAHYTSRDDIMLIVEPVVMQPLRREWDEVRAECDKLHEKVRKSGRRTVGKRGQTLKKSAALTKLEKTLDKFTDRLAGLRILDPACGSGNFLYVAIQELLGLEKEVITYAAGVGMGLFPKVRPTQLHGIELNLYAAELAQVVIWIGYLQWMRDNGFNAPRNPILEPLQTIENRDAILDLTIPTKPQPATWPQADFIIGNPPFLGGGYIRQGLGDKYVEMLFGTYDLPNFSDLCCYWFELAGRAIERQPTVRAGLLATQGIRGSVNRTVIERIQRIGSLFMAWSDRNWVLDGAAVHVAMLGFDGGIEKQCTLNGNVEETIHSDLTADIDLTKALELPENALVQFEGDKKGAQFEVGLNEARRILSSPCVTDGSVLDACRPWFNGRDMNGRPRAMWIIDFGPSATIEDASKFEAAFEVVQSKVAPKYSKTRKRWWLHERPRPSMREALSELQRFLVTVRHAPHRLFAWATPDALPDSAVVTFARQDDYFMGVLQSAIHVLWARRIGTQVREKESGDRYLGSCFETFALPWPPGDEDGGHEVYQRISAAAAELNEQRERWLNPPEWIDPIARSIDERDDFADVPEEARPLIRQSAIMAAAAEDSRLKKRTLTNLYNQRPTWLRLAHQRLDRAVLAAYAATDTDGDWSEDWAKVWVDSGAGQPLPDADDGTPHPLAERRQEIDQRVLANLLRLNLSRADKD